MLTSTRLKMAASARSAAPAQISYVGGNASSGFASSRTVAQPTGVQAGDIGLIVGRNSGQPSGWTACTIGYYKIYGAGESSVVVPSASGSSQNMVVTLSVFRNVHPTSPFDAEATPKSTTSGTSIGTNSVTAVRPRTMQVTAVTAGVSSGTPSLTIPSGFSTGPLGGMSTACTGLAYQSGPAVGAATGTPSWTISIATFSSTGWNLLLRPYDT